jgi:hypothetical protein
MAFRLPLTLALVVGLAATASAYRVITLHQVDVTGAIVQIGPNSIEVKAANGKNWILNLQQGVTKVAITGAAEPEMLKQGTCVRFVARIDKRTSKAQDKIDAITIFNPTPGAAQRSLGVELAGEAPQGKEGDAAGLPLGPAAGGGLPDDGAAGKSAKRRPPAAKGPDKSVPDIAVYDVCAEIVSYRAGHLVVNVQNRYLKPRILADLTPDARIGLDLDDLSLAKPGDKVTASGFYATAGVCEQVDSIEVALSSPLAPPGSRPRRPRPVARGDAAQPAAEKAKTGAVAAGKKAAPPGTAGGEKAPAKEAAAEADPAADMTLAKDNPPARALQPVEPDPAPRDVATPVAPSVAQTAPEAKKPVTPEPARPETAKPEKKLPVVDDDDVKDVFEK